MMCDIRMETIQSRVELVAGDVPRLRFFDEIDLQEIQEARRQALRILDENGRSLIIDLSDLPSINSSGIGFLVAAQKSFAERGGRVVIARLSPVVRRTIETVGLQRWLTITSSIKKAEELLKS